jgi:2-polyprenyl-6-methoxyphenol hydroxylase-like FAD-dependent oxidoreductase
MSARDPVLVVGAGPTGLMLAIELGRRGVPTLVISDSVETSTTPKATVTQARTMEHFRRLGLAEVVRRTGVPGDHATDIVYCSRITWHELARHRLPSPNEARRIVREAPERWHTPELTHRSSQMWIEPILLAECRRLPAVQLSLGWRAVRFAEVDGGVTLEVERVADGSPRTLRGAFLVGCDGAASMVRAQLGIGRGDSAQISAFKGRPMFSVHARAPQFFDRVPFGRGWLFAAVNCVQRGSCISLNGTELKFSFWRPEHWTGDQVTKAQIAEVHHRMFGGDCDFDVIGHKFWRGGASLVADSYRSSRVFLAGDAAHLFTPSAGLGYCTGIDDAVNLGWKLAAVAQGWGGPALLDSYERECRPEALRRTRFAAECAERLAVFRPTPDLDQDTPAGASARAEAAAYFASHLPRQYDIPGINFGARFDGSPVVLDDGTPPPADHPNHYVPTGKPGGRAPHAWLSDGRALQDVLGTGLTLLQLAEQPSAEPFRRAAAARGVPLTVVDLSRLAAQSVRDLYEADLVLVRPDQIVAWRGSGTSAPADSIIARAAGW